METKPHILFSIVIPTYNRAHLIGKTIESILKQTYPNYEIIVIDDGSTDDTEETLRKYVSHNLIYVKKENAERAAARNYGSRLARGNYINWFDSDDIMLPNHLAQAKKMVAKYNMPEIFALPYQVETLDGKVIEKNKYPMPTINHKMYLGNRLACNPVFVRKDTAQQFPFNEDRTLTACEDYELWMRLAARYPIYCSNIITSNLIQHGQRSVNTMVDCNNLIERHEKLLYYTLKDNETVAFLGRNKNSFTANVYFTLSILLARYQFKKFAFLYFIKAIRTGLGCFLQKKFYVAIKYIIK